MIIETIADCLRTIQYLILLNLFLEKKPRELLHLKSMYVAVVISTLQVASNILNENYVRGLLPIGVMGVLFLYVWRENSKLDRKRRCLCVIESYITSYIIDFLLGFICAFISRIAGKQVVIDGKMYWVIVLRVVVVIGLMICYYQIQRNINKMAMSVMTLLGTFVLFFQQFMQTALVTKDYSLISVLSLFIYLTMIFTAFMLLQHNRLTAKQQAI